MSKSKYRYKNGQAVRVRENIEQCTNYYMHSGPDPERAYANSRGVFRHSPYSFRGQTVHISHKANGLYKIMEDGKSYYYSDDMFEPVKPFFCKSLL